MSALRPLGLRERAPDLPHPDAESIRAFLGGFPRAAVLPAGARLFRYGLRLTRGPEGIGGWIPMSEARLESADAALDFCAPRGTPEPSGEAPDGEGGVPDPGAPVRDEFMAATDLPVWVGEAGILVRRTDVERGSLRSVGVPVPLARVRPLR